MGRAREGSSLHIYFQVHISSFAVGLRKTTQIKIRTKDLPNGRKKFHQDIWYTERCDYVIFMVSCFLLSVTNEIFKRKQ
jgi:hypothetical protein